MQINRRDLLGGAAFGLSFIAAPAWAAAGVFTPEQFGAKGDGITNDTNAFARMAAAVSAQGGGEIVFRRATYIVGRQLRGHAERTGYSFEPAKILEFVGLSGPLTIHGNGARLRSTRGLRYGTFEPVSGSKTTHRMPYFGSGDLATPYRAMILIKHCAGPVEISDLELDGNLSALQIGGQFGDTGWQIPAVGIMLQENAGAEKISRVYSHHHAQDGIQIDGLDRIRGSMVATIFKDVRCEYNARQGVSLVGGRGYLFKRCQFNHTGKANITSNPGAGVDIEAEGGKKIRDVSFVSCEFANNSGCGLVADTGDSEGASFNGCTFVGTTSWSAWPNKPRFRFSGCTFVGALVHAFGDKSPERATQFRHCTFRDDPTLSPTKEIFGGENPDRPIADLPGNENVLFHRCRFLLTANSVLPWSVNVTYSDCTLSQRSSRVSYPRGTYIGRNTLMARSDLYSSNIIGELIHNGMPVRPGRVF